MKRVVITGMGVISPVGNHIESFWSNIVDGLCGIDTITRFDTTDFKVKVAAEVKDFQALDYLAKNEIRKTDLFSQYAIAAASQAIDDSEITGKVAPERFGVYVGSGIGGMDTLTKEIEKFLQGGAKKVSPYFIPMIISNIAAGHIAIRHQAQGPCLPIVTACATSSHAIGEAFRAIKHGYADAIIAGGTEASLIPVSVAGFTNIMALSQRNDPQSSSIPFDKRRDGFVMGEGAGILVLEEYEHAIKRNAKIYAEINGYGNTCDAFHVTAPEPEAKSATVAIQAAIHEAEAHSIEKIYVNAHGTSTPLNDKVETQALKNALGDKAYQAFISSTKSMTGHMLGAAGAVEAIVAILTLKNGVIPPTIGLKEPDLDCDLNYVPNKSICENVELALSTSLGFGGHNACLAFVKAQ